MVTLKIALMYITKYPKLKLTFPCFGKMSDHNRQVKGLRRILILLWHISTRLTRMWNQHIQGRNFSSGYIKRKSRCLNLIKVLNKSKMSLHYNCLWRLIPPDRQEYISKNENFHSTWGTLEILQCHNKELWQPNIGKTNNNSSVKPFAGNYFTDTQQRE